MLESRLSRLEESLVGAVEGAFVHIEPEHDDSLAAIELGFNMVIETLRDRVAEVEQINRELDIRVAARTEELERQVGEVTRQRDLIRRQQEAIHELSTPVLQLWDGVVAMPIIGTIDGRRSEAITETLLTAVTRGNARFAILDITGVEGVDTDTAGHLLRMISATRLLGSRCVLTGVRPDVAQTLVTLGVDLDELLIRRNLQAGLKTCLLAMSGGTGQGERG